MNNLIWKVDSKELGMSSATPKHGQLKGKKNEVHDLIEKSPIVHFFKVIQLAMTLISPVIFNLVSLLTIIS